MLGDFNACAYTHACAVYAKKQLEYYYMCSVTAIAAKQQAIEQASSQPAHPD